MKSNEDSISSVKENKKNTSNIIKFYKDNTKKNRKRVLIGVILITITFFSGWVGGRVSVSNVKDQVISNIKDTNVELQIIESLQKTSNSIVGIGSSEESFNKESTTENLTGVVIGEEGYILTTYDTIKDFKDVYVKLPSKNNNLFKAEIYFYDIELDYAILKIDSKNLTEIKFASSTELQLGRIVLSAVNTKGENYISYVTNGMISSFSNKDKVKIVQSNIIASKKLEGSPLINLEGNLIGICSNKISGDLKSELVNVIELDSIKDSITRMFMGLDKLGIKGGPVIADSKNKYSGVYITEVIPNKVAYKAGIKPTDIILEINGKSVGNKNDIFGILSDIPNGYVVPCSILRDGKRIKLDMKID